MRVHFTSGHLVLALAFTIMPGLVFADHPTFGFGTGVAGPITTVSADPLPRRAWVLGLRGEFLNLARFSDAELFRLARPGAAVDSTDSLLSPFAVVGYGVTDDLTIAARLPYVQRANIREGELENGEPHVHSHGDATGLGDLSLFGQYRLLAHGGFSTTLLGGINLPIGRTDVADASGHPFELEHQPGEGAWSPLLGVAVRRTLGRLTLDANVLYTFVTEAAPGNALGDLANYNVALSYRFGGETDDDPDHVHDAHSHRAWDLVAELNGEWRDRLVEERRPDPNSGGSVLYFSPGVRLTLNDRWSSYVSVGLPVLERLNGTQHESHVRLIAGVGLALQRGATAIDRR